MAVIRDWDPDACDIIINCGTFDTTSDLLLLGGALYNHKLKTIIPIVYYTNLSTSDISESKINDSMRSASIIQIGKSDPWTTDIDPNNLPQTRVIGFVKFFDEELNYRRLYIGASYGGSIYIYWADLNYNYSIDSMSLQHPNTKPAMADYHNGAINVFSGIPVGNTSLFGHFGMNCGDEGDDWQTIVATVGSLVVTYDDPTRKSRYLRIMIVDLPNRTASHNIKVYEKEIGTYAEIFAGLIVAKHDGGYYYYYLEKYHTKNTNNENISIICFCKLYVTFTTTQSYNTGHGNLYRIPFYVPEDFKMGYYQPISIMYNPLDGLIIGTGIGRTTARYDGESPTNDQFSTYIVNARYCDFSEANYCGELDFEDVLPSSEWRPNFVACISSPENSNFMQIIVAPGIITYSDSAILHTCSSLQNDQYGYDDRRTTRITQRVSLITSGVHDHYNPNAYQIPTGSNFTTNYCRYSFTGGTAIAPINTDNYNGNRMYLCYGMHNTKVSGYDDLNWRPLINIISNYQLIDTVKKITATPIPILSMNEGTIQEYLDYRDIHNPGLPNNSQAVNRIMVSSSIDSKKLEEIKIGTVEAANEKELTNDINNRYSR